MAFTSKSQICLNVTWCKANILLNGTILGKLLAIKQLCTTRRHDTSHLECMKLNISLNDLKLPREKKGLGGFDSAPRAMLHDSPEVLRDTHMAQQSKF